MGQRHQRFPEGEPAPRRANRPSFSGVITKPGACERAGSFTPTQPIVVAAELEPPSLLVERAKRREGPALAEFFQRHEQRLGHYFTGPLHWHEHLVPDLVQETLTRAIAAFPRFRGTSEPEAERWLFGIARNVHLQEVSRQVGIRLRKEVASELARHIRSGQGGWHASDIRTALDELPLCQLEVLRLLLEGHSSKEIAEELDLPEGTVASRLYRARERIRARLGIDW